MSLTLNQLNAITQSHEARMLPTRMPAGSLENENANWWDHVDEVLRRATESDLLTVALYARVMLETYPGLINSIDLSWSTEGDRGDIYIDNSMRINGSYYHPDSHELDAELHGAMEDIDDAAALHALYGAAESAMGNRQASSELMDRAEKLFGDITSIEDVNAIIAKIDPEIRAFYEQKILALETPASSAPKGPGRF